MNAEGLVVAAVGEGCTTARQIAARHGWAVAVGGTRKALRNRTIRCCPNGYLQSVKP